MFAGQPRISLFNIFRFRVLFLLSGDAQQHWRGTIKSHRLWRCAWSSLCWLLSWSIAFFSNSVFLSNGSTGTDTQPILCAFIIYKRPFSIALTNIAFKWRSARSSFKSHKNGNSLPRELEEESPAVEGRRIPCLCMLQKRVVKAKARKSTSRKGNCM